MPCSAISKQPTSSAGPNRFWTPAPAATRVVPVALEVQTTSTRCSRMRGPAMDPSLVTCPTMMTAAALLRDADERRGDLPHLGRMPRHPVRHRRTTRSAPSRRSAAGSHLVDVPEDRGEVGLGGEVELVGKRPGALSPQTDLGRRFLTRHVERAPGRPGPSARPPQKSRVDLPTPGSPASSTTAPGTNPSPSTRSSSVTPVSVRAARSALTWLIGTAVRAARWRSPGQARGAPTSTTPPQAWHSPQIDPTPRGRATLRHRWVGRAVVFAMPQTLGAATDVDDEMWFWRV